MSANALTKVREVLPAVFDDFFKPWSEWFDGKNGLSKVLTIPAVNIAEEADCYKATLAVPGMKKEDFNIDVNGNFLTISAEKEEQKEDKEKKFTRKEYNYSSFSRSFSLPNGIKNDSIEAKYTDGLLELTLPKRDEAKTIQSKKIAVN